MNRLKPKRQKEGVEICCNILTHFGVKHTRKQVGTLLEDHVDYPSLLSLHDVLSEYGIVSTAIRKGDFSYEDVETPYISSIQQKDWSSPNFTVVSGAENSLITYIDPVTRERKTVSLTDFEKIDKGILLLIDGEGAKDESNYLANRSDENRTQAIRALSYVFVGLFLLIPLAYLLSASVFEGTRGIISFSFLINGLVGVGGSVLLLWHDVDAHNPFIKEVCGGQGKKMNCGAVLNSKGANFLGISWSIWGFAYFLAFFLVQLFYPGQVAQLTLWSTISLLALPYVPYSIYYQWRVVKQWCPLCLTVQAILLLNAIASVIFITGDTVFVWDWYPISITVLLGVFSLILGDFVVPLLKQAKDSRDYEHKWKKLRYNAGIFQALLQKSDPVTVPVDGLGIVVGNPDANHEIIKVCNPYCGPCSKAHPILEELIRENDDVKLRIIFTASGDDTDKKTLPVAHLLAVEEKYGNEKVHQALDDWYLAENKDYQVFSSKHPMNGELKLQYNKIKAMREWCDAMKIRATPTIYIDRRELPDTYRVEELKNLL
ncbi:MAG: vitamin K epoxide reductase family protein [Sphingobacterium sp.]